MHLAISTSLGPLLSSFHEISDLKQCICCNNRRQLELQAAGLAKAVTGLKTQCDQEVYVTETQGVTLLYAVLLPFRVVVECMLR